MELDRILKKRRKDAHKGDFGQVFILAGSAGLTGAAALCANATLRAGAGSAVLGIPESLNPAMEAKLTEVMTLPLPQTQKISVSIKAKKQILERISDSQAVVLGPGLSVNSETQRLVRQLIVEIRKPMVLDADALNAVSCDVQILKKIKTSCIITPHSGEMSGLTGKSTVSINRNRIAVAKNFAYEYNAIVVLKGAGTIVADIRKKTPVYVNKTGNPGMATAGSGDVLTGVIAGFLAQGLESFEAAKLGVYIHGLAGDLAAKEKGEVGLIAGDILDNIPYALFANTRV